MNSPFLTQPRIAENTHAFAIWDNYPVSQGHALVLPFRVIASFFDLHPDEKQAMFLLLDEVKKIIHNKYEPDGYNIGINIGEAAGQTIFHVHMHLIPRYQGDIENPKGGVRGVIPNKRDYTIEGLYP